jgi:hypothetical protein
MAAKEHTDRLAAIAQHQLPPGGIQGVPDTQDDPDEDNKEVQYEDPDEETEPKRQRGKGKMNE